MKNIKNKFIILILALIVVSLLPKIALADMGPKPTAEIHVTLNGQTIPDASFNAKMLTCQHQMKYDQIIADLAQYENASDPTNWYDKCSEIAPNYGFEANLCHIEISNERWLKNEQTICKEKVEDLLCVKIADAERGCYWTPAALAWGGNCASSNCNFNYFLPPSFRLAVYLPSQDKLYLSAEVSRNNFKSTFDANLLPDGSINIIETTPFSQSDTVKFSGEFVIALILTLIIELFVASIFLFITKVSRKVLISVVAGSLITLPFVWFIFPSIMDAELAILLGELFAFVFEGFFIYSLNKKRISFKKAFALSFLMNLASFLIGGFMFISFFVIY